MNSIFLTIFLGLIVLAVLVVAAYVIYAILELRALLQRIRMFLNNIEGNLKGTLEETEKSLRSTRMLIDNVEGMTEDVKVLTQSVRDVGENIRTVNDFVSSIASPPLTQASAVKAGVRAGVEYLVKHMAARKKNA